MGWMPAASLFIIESAADYHDDVLNRMFGAKVEVA
ncbi:MAG: hypothetical protein ACJAYF_000130 [Arenicella sp.]|jgi:hypothetical protein